MKKASALYAIVQPFLDITILAFLLYFAYRILVKTQAIQLLKGTVSLFLIYAIAFLLKLNTLLWLLNILAPGLLIGVAIVFQRNCEDISQDWPERLAQNWNRSKHSHLDSVMTTAEILSTGDAACWRCLSGGTDCGILPKPGPGSMPILPRSAGYHIRS